MPSTFPCLKLIALPTAMLKQEACSIGSTQHAQIDACRWSSAIEGPAEWQENKLT